MKYLLDTHILLWFLLAPEKVPVKHMRVITGSDTEKFISPVCLWEVSLKYSLGKLDLGGNSPDGVWKECLTLGFRVLPLLPEDCAYFYKLPVKKFHKDPFDRMLIWQAIQSDVILLSHDRKLPQYKPQGLRLA